MAKKKSSKPGEYVLAVAGPGKDPQKSVGAHVAEKAVDDMITNPEESGLVGIILEKRDDDTPAKAIKHIIDTKISRSKVSVKNPKTFVTIAGYDKMVEADVIVVCSDAGTDYANKYHAGVPPSAADSFEVNNQIVIGGKRKVRGKHGRIKEKEFAGIAKELIDRGFEGSVGFVTNPSDYMAHLMWARVNELLKDEDPKRAARFMEQIWGFTPEKPRLGWAIAEYLTGFDKEYLLKLGITDKPEEIRPEDVDSQSCGPHDVRDFMVAALSMTQIKGYSEAEMNILREGPLFEGRHTIKEKLKDHGPALMKLAGNTSQEVGIYIQDAIKLMAGVRNRATISRFLRLSDGNNLETLLGDFRTMNKRDRVKALSEFLEDPGLNDAVRDYVHGRRDAIIEFEKFLENDPGAFLSLPYERVNGILQLQSGFRLNQMRWNEPIQFLAAYMNCGGFGTEHVLPLSKGEKPKIGKSIWRKYQKIVGSRYIIVNRVGGGGQGTVLHVKDPYDKYQEYALKLYTELAKTELSKDWERFYRQVRIQMNLDHPNIVKCYGLALGLKDCPGLLLEYIEHPDHGEKDLKEIYVDSEHNANFSQICDIFKAIGSALQEIHSHRTSETNRSWYVHRDVKPKNFLLAHEDGKDVVKLGDFGAAAIIPEMSLTGKETMMMGTLSYLPPEGIVKNGKVPLKQVTPTMDTYSAGVSLYELATGIKPERDEEGNFEGGPESIKFRTIVSLKGNDQRFEYFDDLVKRCLDPEWEEGRTKRPMDGEEFLYEVRIASNYDTVKAYENAIKEASDNVKDGFKITVDDIKKVHDALAEVHKALKDIPDGDRSEHIGKNFGRNLDAVVSDEANLGNSRSIFRRITDNYKTLVADCYSHIGEFAESTRPKAEAGTATPAEGMEKVERYKGLMGALPLLAPKKSKD